MIKCKNGRCKETSLQTEEWLIESYNTGNILDCIERDQLISMLDKHNL